MQQLIFIHIPKTAGVSVANTLKESGVLVQSKGRKYGFVHKPARDLILKEDLHYPTVAVVRNPFDRIYSIFEFYQKKRTDVPKDITFEEFVLSFEKKFLNKKPQFTDCFNYVCDSKREGLIVTDILKFETLQKDFDELSRKYSFFASLQDLNKNELKKTSVNKSELFTEKMKQIVEKVFEKDLLTFDYSYEKFLNIDF